MIRTWDVGIAGGGPAGLAAAIPPQVPGPRLVVVDRLRPPIDHACGPGLVPHSAVAMQRLGVDTPTERARRFSGFSFVEKQTHVTGGFLDGYGFGVRRTVLHQAMVARAEACGVSFRWGTSVTSVDRQGL